MSNLTPADLPLGTLVRDLGTGRLGRIVPRIGWPSPTFGINAGADEIYSPIYARELASLVEVQWYLAGATKTIAENLSPTIVSVEAQSLELA